MMPLTAAAADVDSDYAYMELGVNLHVRRWNMKRVTKVLPAIFLLTLAGVAYG
jgi:hypothetical protein